LKEEKTYTRGPMKTGLGIDFLETIIYTYEGMLMSPMSCLTAGTVANVLAGSESELEKLAINTAAFFAPQILTYIGLRLPIYKHYKTPDSEMRKPTEMHLE
jgi:hypothetical protein